MKYEKKETKSPLKRIKAESGYLSASYHKAREWTKSPKGDDTNPILICN